jgi:hypothetical protein
LCYGVQEFASKLEEKLTGVATPQEEGLLGSDGSKKSDALELAYVRTCLTPFLPFVSVPLSGE